jgi:hypothetical protein
MRFQIVFKSIRICGGTSSGPAVYSILGADCHLSLPYLSTDVRVSAVSSLEEAFHLCLGLYYDGKQRDVSRGSLQNFLGSTYEF